MESQILGTSHLDGYGASLFRNDAQLASVLTKLGLASTAVTTCADSSIQRARIETASELLTVAVVGMLNGKGLARVSDACRVLSAGQVTLLCNLMIAANDSFDAIDTWIAS